MENGWRKVLGPEQRGLAFREELAQKIPKPCGLMLDAFAGTLSTAKIDPIAG